MFHMNNARYLRECDFGRFKFFIQNRSWDALESLGGCMSNAGNNIRYRRSIELFNIYKIKTRVSIIVCDLNRDMYANLQRHIPNLQRHIPQLTDTHTCTSTYSDTIIPQLTKTYTSTYRDIYLIIQGYTPQLTETYTLT